MRAGGAIWISLTLAGVDLPHVRGAHVNFLVTAPPPDPAALAGLEPSDLERLGLLGADALRRPIARLSAGS